MPEFRAGQALSAAAQRRGMRHLFVAAALVGVALIITFGVATMLQGLATSRREPMPEPIAEPPPATAPAPRARPESGRALIVSRRISTSTEE